MNKLQIIAAAGLLFGLRANAQSTIYSGTGFGTYYYDVVEVEACGTDFSAQNQGPVECSFSTALSLDQINSNYIVAMNHSQLVGDMALYCGKKVVVSVNGVASDLPLFIGDGCARCGTGSSSSDVWNADGAPGLDFSYSVLSELSSSACTDGHISITWEIVDETLYNFDTNAPGSPEGPVGGSGSSSPATSAAAAAPPAQSPASSASPSSSPATTAVAAPAPPVQTSASNPSPSPSPSPASEDPQPVFTPPVFSHSFGFNQAAVPTTLVTAASSSAAASSSNGAAVSSGTPTIYSSPSTTSSSGACATGTWQCSGTVLEQCLDDVWAPIVTCAAGLTCQGGDHPYCAPPGWDASCSS